jgi:hypothetical protein
MTRALSTLAGAAAAGGLIWVAAQMDQDETGGYWAQMGILVGAGLALALARLPDIGVRTLIPSLPTFTLAFLPSLIAAGWIVVAAQPHGNTWRRHVLGWSDDIGVTRLVRDLGPFAVVLALGLGALLGLVFERRAIEPVPIEPVPVEPVVAPATERAEASEATLAPTETALGERAASDDVTVVREHELTHH